MDIHGLRERKRKWAENLDVGDIVEDCRCKEFRIAEIKKEYGPPNWFYRFILGYTPFWMHGFLEALARRILPAKYYDSQFELEDGSNCSAMNCCDPAAGDISEYADYLTEYYKSPEYLKIVEEYEKMQENASQ